MRRFDAFFNWMEFKWSQNNKLEKCFCTIDIFFGTGLMPKTSGSPGAVQNADQTIIQELHWFLNFFSKIWCCTFFCFLTFIEKNPYEKWVGWGKNSKLFYKLHAAFQKKMKAKAPTLINLTNAIMVRADRWWIDSKL